MYVMGTIQDIFSGSHIDRANRTTSPERFRPGMQVAYNSNDYEFSIDSTNQFFMMYVRWCFITRKSCS